MSWIADIFTAIGQAFTNLGSEVLTFLKDGFVTLFLTTQTVEGVTTITGVSAFGIFGFILIGISLVLGLTKFITSMVRRKI